MRSSLSLAFCLFLAGAAQAQELNVLTGVEVRNEGNTVLVTVKGSKPPNFTTFSMADPARFVIDFSEAKFQGVPEDMRIEDGVIRVIKNLAYGSGATAIARVMLAFSVDVDPPDVQTSGTSLLVRMNKPADAAVAATGSQPASAASPTATGGAAGAAGAEAAEASAAAVAAASARADAEAVRQETLAREQREVEAREQARLAAETSAKEREAQARVESEARAREAEKAAAEQAAAEQARLAAVEARRAEIKARAAAEELQAQQASGQPPAAAVQPQSADAERAARVQAEADARARREIEAALAAQQPAAAASSRAPAPVPGTPEVPARAAKLQAVGFKQLPTVSRVFVKTSVTPRFTITDVGDDVVRLEVENTRASRRNDTRPLDTSFFPTAVALISPSRVGTSYVVDIKLKKRVPYQQKVEGDVLAIDFERPPALGEGGTPGATETPAGPAAGAPGDATLENQQGLVIDPDDKADGAGAAVDKEPAAEPKQ